MQQSSPSHTHFQFYFPVSPSWDLKQTPYFPTLHCPPEDVFINPPSTPALSLVPRPNAALCRFLQFPQLGRLSMLRQNPVLLPFITKSCLISIHKEILSHWLYYKILKRRAMTSLSYLPLCFGKVYVYSILTKLN